MGEALDAMGRHHLYEAEQKAYSAAILSVDSTELAEESWGRFSWSF